MSGTTPTPQVLPYVNKIVNEADSFQNLVDKSKVADPVLYSKLLEYLNGTPFSHSPLIGVLGGAVSYGVMKLGLDWTSDTDTLVSTAIVVGVSYLWQFIVKEKGAGS